MSHFDRSARVHSRKRNFLARVAGNVAVVAALCLAFAFMPDAAASSPSTLRNATSDSAPTVRLPGHVLPALNKATRVSPTSAPALHEAGQPLNLTIVLKRDHQASFERYLRALYDRKSPIYRHFLSQREIADRFGPSEQDYNTTLAYLEARGFTLIQGSTNRLTLTMRGTRAIAERTFDVAIDDYAIGKRNFYANDRDPALPREIASRVEAIEGLSNLAEPRPSFVPITQPKPPAPPFPPPKPPSPPPPGPPCSAQAAFQCAFDAAGSQNGCFQSQQAQKCYQQCLSNGGSPGTYNGSDLGGLLNTFVAEDCGPDPAAPAAINGAGQTVGLVEFDSYVQSDVANYLGLLGLPASTLSNVTKVDVDGGVAPGPNQAEVLVDINAVLTTAPGAKIAVYDAPFKGAGASFQTVLNQMINDKVSIISNSWAYCEDQTTAADVNSIDSILENAAAANITVFSGAGDSGSTCLDGSAGTISVPADSPHLTAVGGTSVTPGPGNTYGTETWWNGTNNTPPTGQGGFGLSTFFPAPSYQTTMGLTKRSIPDVAINADPAAAGVVICQATAGGCPTGLLYGGTSVATPMWAGIAAVLNQALGHNLGQLNPLIYPLTGNAFNSGTSMSPATDFAHVGLGSPNIDALELALSGQTVGSPSATTSQVYPGPLGAAIAGFQPADGATEAAIVVTVRDSNSHPVSGQSVTLAGDTGSSVQISPASLVTNANGTVVFTATDLVVESVTFTATAGGLTLTPALTPTVNFVTPPAASAGISALPSTVTADGVSTTTITVTLEDALSRPTPGKLISLTQSGGSSVIKGPNPPVTNSSGQVVFTATDTNNETITYGAVDVSDQNLPFPGTAQVQFSSSAASGCGIGTPIAAPGYVITPIATGFEAAEVSAGDITFSAIVGCPGAGTPAFDSSGNIYASDFVDGNVYKFPSSGGVAGSGTLLATIGQTAAQATFSGSNLWVVRAATTSGVGPSGFYEVNPSTGSIVNSFTGVFCSIALAADPLSGDLFSANDCGTDATLFFSTLAGSPPVFSA